MNYDYINQGVKKRQEILDFIIEFITENNYSPSVREIAKGVGMGSLFDVHRHLEILVHNGKIKMKQNQPRTISVVGYEFRKVE